MKQSNDTSKEIMEKKYDIKNTVEILSKTYKDLINNRKTIFGREN